MRLLFYEWNSLTHPYIYKAMKEQGIHLDIAHLPYKPRKEEDYDKFKETLRKMLKLKHYDVVFSINFFDLIADVCHDKGVLYVAWTYDCPSLGGRKEARFYDTNRIFLFDSGEVALHNALGEPNVYHMNLAVDVEELAALNETEEQKQKYTSEISFVGRLYSVQQRKMMQLLTPYWAGYLQALVNTQFKIYNADILNELVNDKLLDMVVTPEFSEEMIKFQQSLGVYKDTPVAQALKVFLQQAVTNKERVTMLSVLSNYFPVNFFTSDEQEPALEKVHFCGSVDYWEEMPLVFRNSKINLNITSRTITKGVPQRCLDVMGCRGLLMSNYQEDMFEYLENGRDLIIYSDLGDAVEKADFYLKHEDEAQRIRENGYQKMIDCYSYKGQLEKIWKQAGVKL